MKIVREPLQVDQVTVNCLDRLYIGAAVYVPAGVFMIRDVELVRDELLWSME